jgi:Secretion system C-terminal sorting domain
MPVVLNEFGSNYLSFEFINNYIGFAGGYSTPEHPYGLLKTEDSGISWGYQSVEYFPNQIENFGPPFVSIRSISCPTGNDTCYAVGAFGGIWRTFNGGGPTQALPVSVSEHQSTQKTLKAYPNPTSSTFRIEASHPHEVRAIELYNTTGQLVAQYASMPYEIDVKFWPSGCYNVVVKYDNEVVRTRVVVD